MKEWKDCISQHEDQQSTDGASYVNNHKTPETQRILNKLSLNMSAFVSKNTNNFPHEVLQYIRSIKQQIEILNNEIDINQINQANKNENIAI